MDSAADALRLSSRYFTIRTYDKDSSTKMDLDAVFNLRYQVYCIEAGFLDPGDYPDQLEMDDDDQRSIHFGAKNSAGLLAGTSRLVLGSDDQPFPYATHCPPFDGFTPPPWQMSAEVSRLAVSKKYRRRAGDSMSGVNELDAAKIKPPPLPNDKRVGAPLLVLSLYREMFQYSKAHGIRYWYAAMERPLVRVLARYGFLFTPIGEQRDYWGPVTPYIGDLQQLENALDQSNPELMDWFRYG